MNPTKRSHRTNSKQKRISLRKSLWNLLGKSSGQHTYRILNLGIELLESRRLLSMTHEPTVALHHEFAQQQIIGTFSPPGDGPNAPGADSTIEGINFGEDGTNSGLLHIPPDPIGAAGPNHVVSVVNTSIEWHTKAGVQQNSQRLGRNATTAVGSFFVTVHGVI